MRARTLLLGLGLVAMATTTASDEARACLNGTERRLDELVAAVAGAERAVADGKPQLAAKVVLSRYPRIRTERVGRNRVADRALRVMARAVVRTRGAIDAGPRFPGKSSAEQSENLTWAMGVLHGFAGLDPKSAAAKTDYAEALAQIPDRQREALRVLEDLAAKDLVGSAQGYAALADLRAYRADGKPSFIAAPGLALAHVRIELARARCRRMAADDGICGGAPNDPQS
jgi:hypothetical protein